MMSLFDILFDIIAAAGPFLVFAGMGDGKDSGKLLFKTFKSSDSSVEFTEDSTGLTFSSQGGSVAINLNEIAFGTGTGITSSNNPISNCNFKVDGRTGYESITGVKFIGVEWCSNYNRPPSCNHLIIGGKYNGHCSDNYSKNNVILGGCKNCIRGLHFSADIGRGSDNVIVGGQNNCLRLSTSTTIIGGTSNSFTRQDYPGEPGNGTNPGFFYTLESSIIASSNINQKKGAIQSSIISSYCADYSNTTTIYDMYRTSIISSCKFSGFKSCTRMCNSTIISSGCVRAGSKYTSLISTLKSTITGTPSGSLPTLSNSIISSYGSLIRDARDNSIISSSFSLITMKSLGIVKIQNNSFISGSKNCISVNYLVSSGSRFIKNSSIISGTDNCIYVEKTGVASRTAVCNSSIISGNKNSILNSENSVIVSGTCNQIYLEKNSVIMSGFKNYLFGTISVSNNVIMSGNYNKMCYDSTNSIFLSTSGAYQRCGIFNAIISSSSSCIRARVFNNFPMSPANSNVIISTALSCIIRNDTLFGGSRSSLISGYNNCATSTYDSSIVGGRFNSLKCSNSSSILGGRCNLILFVRSANTVIDARTIIGGYKNCLCEKPKMTSIIGGFNNSVKLNVEGAAIVGGENICNKYANTTMVPTICIGGKTWMNGFTGSNGIWITGTPICVCCGLIISGPA